MCKYVRAYAVYTCTSIRYICTVLTPNEVRDYYGYAVFICSIPVLLTV